MFKKVFISLVLIVGSLNAQSKFKANIGCKIGTHERTWVACIKSIKLNGRLKNNYELQQEYGFSPTSLTINLPEHFDLTVLPDGNTKYFVQILTNKGKEVFYDEKANKYSGIRVGN